MSKERAQRRAERAAEQAADQARRDRRAERVNRRRDAAAAVRERVPRRTRWRRQQGLLARRRRAQNAVILGLFLVVQAVVWLLTSDPWVRVACGLLGILALPVLVTLALDRRTRA